MGMDGWDACLSAVGKSAYGWDGMDGMGRMGWDGMDGMDGMDGWDGEDCAVLYPCVSTLQTALSVLDPRCPCRLDLSTLLFAWPFANFEISINKNEAVLVLQARLRTHQSDEWFPLLQGHESACEDPD